jgi:predicted nucleic acid-binding protein
MRLVVADTSPIFYRLSIGQIELLPRLFGKVFVPDAVYKELCHPAGSVFDSRMVRRAS